MPPRHFLIDDDLSPVELEAVLDDAERRKKDRIADQPLSGPQSVALIFEKPSTRTRMSFEVAVAELGGHPIYVDSRTTQLGRGETIEDTAHVLSRYVAAIVMRTFGQDRIEGLAAAAGVPVINALTDLAHPCQALADLLTIREHKGGLSGLTLTYVGDGNNVAHSLLLAGCAAGMQVRVAAPQGFEPDPDVVRRANAIGERTGGTALVTTDPLEAAAGAEVLYTDVWASMGQETDAENKARVLAPYRIDNRLVNVASSDVIVLHCLPAHRGEEISAEVMDGPHSRVFDQAENRLHTSKAILAFLLGAA
ncbi:MAG: ornithine carbamoyltransferase [Actinomycetes bacterium]